MNRAKAQPFPWKIFYRIVFVQSALVLAALAASGLAGRYFLERQFVYQFESQLREELNLLAKVLPAHVGASWCALDGQPAAFQFAVATASGNVLCSSPGDSKAYEDADTGEPVFERLERGRSPGGYRTTLREGRIFGVLDLHPRDLVLRGSIPLTELSNTMTLFDTSLGFFLLLTALTLGALAVWSARRLVFPLGRLLVKTQSVLAHQSEIVTREDLDRESYDEWLELESNIDDIRRDLVAKTRSLSMEQFELETVMGAISDAILAVDPEGQPLFFNSRFDLLFGSDDLRARAVRLWGIFREPELLNAFTIALKEGRIGATRAIPLEERGGFTRYFSLSVSPLRQQDGTIYGAVGIFHDVTELKMAEQMRIDFVANVSHELRTPLTVIKGYADTLIEDFKEKKGDVYDFMTSIGRNADRLMNLMNDLLDLSSIESIDILQKESTSTEETTKRTLKSLEPTFQKKGQAVTAYFGTKVVFADPNRLEQVLVNLLSNAHKYTPQGGNITVRWESDGDDTLLKVIDSGPGIPIEHHARLFERFYRIDKSRSRDQGGTGLGLAIVKHIMQRHEGVVWVDSSPPQGATFICRFPGSSKRDDGVTRE